MPPLIDREVFFGDPEVSQAKLSPDGQWMTFIKPFNGARNIWIKALDAPFESAEPVTADTRPVPSYFWSQDSSHILYVQDKDGDENFHVWAVDPNGQRTGEHEVFEARDLTPVDGVRASINSLPKSKPDIIIVGMNDRNPSYHDLYEVNIASGERTLIRQNDDDISSWFFDREGHLRLATKAVAGGGTQVLRVDEGGYTLLAESNFEEAIHPIAFHRDAQHVYINTNIGDDVDLSQLMLMDVETGEMELVHQDPEQQVDLASASFHSDSDELMSVDYIGDKKRVYPLAEEAVGLWAALYKAFPQGEVSITSSNREMSVLLVSVSSDINPGVVYIYDVATGQATLQYHLNPDLTPEHLAEMKPVKYTARDGMTIYGYLTLPQGVEPKNLPTVMYIHGGPWARDYWGYRPYAQFLANRGYAVMQVNYRCSTGFGKKYFNAGIRQWGTGFMQHDITDAVEWLKQEGVADPEKICIFGGSYGGYATLAGVTFTPDLFTCGIPYVGPSNLITLIESFPAYWRPFLEGSWYKRVGDPEVEADRDDLIARSPLFHVNEIKVPLLVVHGANDPRVKQYESDQIVEALRDKGKQVEYIVAPDEGHGFRAPNNKNALAVAIEKFLSEQLGGRYQEEVKPETQNRLDEITVDVTTVVATQPE